jgi:ribosome maturation factor RimP
VNGRRKWAGVLVGLSDGDVLVDADDGTHRVPYEALQKANIDSRFDGLSN